MKILPITFALLVFSISFGTFAHDGHDHQSIYASLVHLVWLAPIFVGLSFLYSRILKQLYKIDK
ncbi:MAG: hypothetical protein HRT53_01680 [Colwellia sp.]|nr:hypothetical protein [Colwellia sp.]